MARVVAGSTVIPQTGSMAAAIGFTTSRLRCAPTGMPLSVLFARATVYRRPTSTFRRTVERFQNGAVVGRAFAVASGRQFHQGFLHALEVADSGFDVGNLGVCPTPHVGALRPRVVSQGEQPGDLF